MDGALGILVGATIVIFMCIPVIVMLIKLLYGMRDRHNPNTDGLDDWWE